MSEIVERYSPNFEWGKTHVEITLQMWEFRKVEVVKVGGNCLGQTVLETAVSILEDTLPLNEYGNTYVILTSSDGRTLECVDEDEQSDWLGRMVVGLRIVGLTHPTLNEIRARNGAPPVEGGDVPREPL